MSIFCDYVEMSLKYFAWRQSYFSLNVWANKTEKNMSGEINTMNSYWFVVKHAVTEGWGQNITWAENYPRMDWVSGHILSSFTILPFIIYILQFIYFFNLICPTGVYFVVCMALLVISLTETVLIVRLVHKQDLQPPVPQWLKYLVLERAPVLFCIHKKHRLCSRLSSQSTDIENYKENNYGTGRYWRKQVKWLI